MKSGDDAVDKVRIVLTGKQKSMDGHTEKVSLMAQGQHYLRNGKHFIKYDDSAMDDGSVVATTIKFRLEDSQLVIFRRGAIDVEQSFVLGQSTKAAYHTAYGVMDLMMHTKLLDIDFQDCHGTIHLVYDMWVSGSQVGEYDLAIKIEE